VALLVLEADENRRRETIPLSWVTRLETHWVSGLENIEEPRPSDSLLGWKEAHNDPCQARSPSVLTIEE
jgi:hypothetical protein